MVNILPENPRTQSEYLELHAIPPSALPLATHEDLPMASHDTQDTVPDFDDTTDTTPLTGETETPCLKRTCTRERSI